MSFVEIRNDPLSNYELRQILHRQGFVQVSRVTSKSDGRDYVLKQIDIEHMTCEQKAEAYSEMELTKKLKHPNLITVIDSFESDTKLNILLEYCEKRDLANYLAQQNGEPLAEYHILHLFSQMCFGLLSLHQRQIFHRDLKP